MPALLAHGGVMLWLLLLFLPALLGKPRPRR